MIDIENMRQVIVSGLTNHLNCPVVRSNQNEEPPEEYPFVSYTITRLLSNHKGTWGEYSDGKDRTQATQTWSITIQSDDNSECMQLALSAHDYFERLGVQYLKDNNINVQSVDEITNRDNILTTEYEYRNGFDVVFGVMNETESKTDIVGYIETAEIRREEASE